MATKLQIDNFSALNIKSKLILTTDIALGLTSIPVVNSEDVAADDTMILGNLGSEYSEKVQAAHTGFAPDRNHVVVIAATAAAHSEFDPLWTLFGNQIKVYKAPNIDGTYPPDANFTLLTTLPIDFDTTQTPYTDPAGDTTWWYKITYYNSVTLVETSLQDSPFIIRGGEYAQYTTIEAIRKEAGLYNNQFITDSAIDAQRYRAQFEIDGALQGLYAVPFTAPINPMISVLTEKLAASKLLSTDYGPMASGNSKDANVKLAEFNDLMTKLDNKSYVLTDTNGTNLAIYEAGGNKSWPNENTSTQNGQVSDGYSDRKFRYGMRF